MTNEVKFLLARRRLEVREGAAAFGEDGVVLGVVAEDHEGGAAVEGAQAGEEPGALGDVAIGVAEDDVGGRWKETMGDGEVDCRIAEVDVTPVDDGSDSMVAVN